MGRADLRRSANFCILNSDFCYPAEPTIQLLQRQLALHLVPQLPITNFLFQSWQQIERNIRRLEFPRIAVGDVMHQRS